MKRVLCYGDSNTFGYDPATRVRFPPEIRWTGVLARVLGTDYTVIEEGLNGRTTRIDDPLDEGRNGLTYLVPCLESHAPLDLVTIMLGTNDLKFRFELEPGDIAESAGSLARIAKRAGRTVANTETEVLLIAPPAVTNLSDFDEMFEGAGSKSTLFGEYYRRAADWNGVHFFDAGSVIRSSDLDGIHFEAAEHRVLGEALAAEIQAILQGATGTRAAGPAPTASEHVG